MVNSASVLLDSVKHLMGK